MKIFSLLCSFDYEGSSLLGLYPSLEAARCAANSFEPSICHTNGGYEILESEMGQQIDEHTMTHNID
jgi:hypothetical protein